MTKFNLLLTAAVILPGIAAPAPAQQTAPLISREVFFGNPTATNGRLSPDGQWLSWRAPHNGVLNLWLAPASNPKATRALTNQRPRPVTTYFWSPDSRQILFTADKDGDENNTLYGVDIDSGEKRALTPSVKGTVKIVGISTAVKDRILISLNDRDRRWHDVHSLHLRSGKLTPVLMNMGGYTNFLEDRQLNLRIVSKPRNGGGTDYYRVSGGQVEVTPFEQVTNPDEGNASPAGFTADGRTLYWVDSRGRDTAALIAQDLASGRKTVIAQDAKVDISSTLTNPTTGKVEAYAVNYLKTEWVPLDRRLKEDFDFLRSRLKGDVNVMSRPDADDKWMINLDPVTSSSAAYLYDRKKKALTKLYAVRPELEGAPLVPMHPVEIKSRDGLTLVSYLSLPPGSDADGDGRPEKPVPLIMVVHGGPHGRDNYGYNSQHQWFANRGYAVLSTNFRGSTGFGKKFIAASFLQWGKKMNDDLLDAVQWAVSRGVTTRDKVGITGVSYGGYATLAGLAFTPDVFACGVSMSGQNDLKTLVETLPPDWQVQRLQIQKAIGDPSTPEGLEALRESSPLFKAHQIKHPLIVGQGANDPRVPPIQSKQIVDAATKNGASVTYVLFPDEGHNLVRPVNRIAFNAITENFFAKCLGGRAEPIGDTLKASTVKVPHGAQFVPGL
ncbi:MAG: S9 family peptidase [Chloroflexia bacterium]|nr:S9 family peptidase [Sphingomonas sp.]MBA3643623.1 S9 family peptidase [Chloroflexia bacterium]